MPEVSDSVVDMARGVLERIVQQLESMGPELSFTPVFWSAREARLKPLDYRA